MSEDNTNQTLLMNSSAANPPPAPEPRSERRAGGRLLVLAPVMVLLGAGLAGLWFKYGTPAAGSRSGETRLSSSTLDLLQHLNSPVEIRFYSVLPPQSAPESLQAFSGRVEQLLADFQTANDRQIHVTRNPSTSGSTEDAAAADGVRAFNLDKGACFLGITVVSGSQKESLAQLQPEWESALPYDLARAIQRLTAEPAPAPVAREVAKPSPEIIDSIHRLIPDLRPVSVEQADKIFHAEFMKEYEQASSAAEAEVSAAQQQVVQAQSGGSPDDLAAAQKKLLDVQLAQGEKIKQLAANLQTRLAVFQQLKAAASEK